MLINPVGAGQWARKASGDAVTGAVDTVFGVQVNFGDNAGHIYALVIAHTTRFSAGHQEVGEFLDGDVIFADGTFAVEGKQLVDRASRARKSR